MWESYWKDTCSEETVSGLEDTVSCLENTVSYLGDTSLKTLSADVGILVLERYCLYVQFWDTPPRRIPPFVPSLTQVWLIGGWRHPPTKRADR